MRERLFAIKKETFFILITPMSTENGRGGSGSLFIVRVGRNLRKKFYVRLRRNVLSDAKNTKELKLKAYAPRLILSIWMKRIYLKKCSCVLMGSYS